MSKSSGAKLSKKAREYISRKIKILMDEGYPQKQAVAIAYSYARRKGYKVPESKEYKKFKKEFGD